MRPLSAIVMATLGALAIAISAGAATASVDYECVPAPAHAEPPPPIEIDGSVITTPASDHLTAICPDGQVPYPIPTGGVGYKTSPPWVGRATGPVLTLEQLLVIALPEAKLDGDAQPTETVIAKGRLVVALKVMNPRVTTPAARLEAAGGANSLVYLVAMHGHFVIHSHPHGKPEPTGRVLELIIDAHTRFVSALSLKSKVPVPLSRLGRAKRYTRCSFCNKR